MSALATLPESSLTPTQAWDALPRRIQRQLAEMLRREHMYGPDAGMRTGRGFRKRDGEHLVTVGFARGSGVLGYILTDAGRAVAEQGKAQS